MFVVIFYVEMKMSCKYTQKNGNIHRNVYSRVWGELKQHLLRVAKANYFKFPTKSYTR